MLNAAVFQVYATFRRNAERQLSEDGGLWCLHLHGLHPAPAGAAAAPAQSPEWALWRQNKHNVLNVWTEADKIPSYPWLSV